MYSGLSLDQAPPLHAPFRFFLTAPLFLILAGFLIALGDPSMLFAHRTPHSIVLIHAVMLGFATMVMLGALTQMLPVLAGVRYPWAGGFAAVVHGLLTVGVVAFLAGFWMQEQTLMLGASGALLLSLGVFAGQTIRLLLRAPRPNATIWGMRIATIALLLTVLLGVHLLSSNALGLLGESHPRLLMLHWIMAGFGWVVVLVMGVAFQVVPMFWVAPGYSAFCKRFILPLAGVVLLGALVVTLTATALPAWIISVVLFVPMGALASTTLRRLSQRKRKTPDVAVAYWMVSMVCLLLSPLLGAANGAWDLGVEPLLAILFGFGFAVMVIAGMLAKIVPFLAWFHLSSMGVFDLPTVRDFIPQKRLWAQFWLSVGTLLALGVTPFLPMIHTIAGALLVLFGVLLLANLWHAARLYSAIRRSHESAPTGALFHPQ